MVGVEILAPFDNGATVKRSKLKGRLRRPEIYRRTCREVEMDATREKLQEAKYFLQRMEDEQADRDAFKYNLSAFLSAARSVTFYMQKEFARAPDFEEWYATEQEAMRRDPVMPFFLDARNRTLKQEYVPTRARIRVDVNDPVGVSDSVGVVVRRGDGTLERWNAEEQRPERPAELTPSETNIEWKWFFQDLPSGAKEKDVMALCAGYVLALGTLVDRCEAKFDV